MVTVLKYGSPKETIKRLPDRLSQQTDSMGIEAYKYCGVIRIDIDPLDI